jgi:hypothetical protein
MPGDRGQVLHRGVSLLGVRHRFADAHVHDDLVELGNLHVVGVAELFLERGADLLAIDLLHPRLVVLAVRRFGHAAIRLAGCSAHVAALAARALGGLGLGAIALRRRFVRGLGRRCGFRRRSVGSRRGRFRRFVRIIRHR